MIFVLVGISVICTSDSEMNEQQNEEPRHSETIPSQWPETTRAEWVYGIATSCIMGLIFGMMFTKSRVFVPENIRGQFIFTRWIMLKMFLGAMGGSCFAIVIASVIKPDSFHLARSVWANVSKQNIISLVFGALCLGAGMAVAGACPGMVLAQIGAGIENSWVTALGGLAGSFSYGLIHPFIHVPLPLFQTAYVDQLINYTFALLTTALGMICILCAIILELVIEFQTETTLSSAWNPTFCGIVIGFLQIPAVTLIGTFLGSSTSYQVLCSTCMIWTLPVTNFWNYFQAFLQPRIQSYWQIFYVAFAILGAYIIEYHLHDFGGKEHGVDATMAFVGGFLMLFGSRMAGGCTSGHGISGCPILMIYSFIAVPVMFIGGIATGFIMDAHTNDFY